MKPGAQKCAQAECCRDAVKRYLGRSTPGRPTQSMHGVLYCAGHYEQLRRGEALRPLRARGVGPYAAAVEDCATIAQFHGHTELAELLRGLNR